MNLRIKKKYTTDGKVVHLSNDEEINVKLGKIIGKKFIDYRKKWNDANVCPCVRIVTRAHSFFINSATIFKPFIIVVIIFYK